MTKKSENQAEVQLTYSKKKEKARMNKVLVSAMKAMSHQDKINNVFHHNQVRKVPMKKKRKKTLLKLMQLRLQAVK